MLVESWGMGGGRGNTIRSSGEAGIEIMRNTKKPQSGDKIRGEKNSRALRILS